MEEDLLSKYLEETGGQVDYLKAIPPNQIQFPRLRDIEKRGSAEGTFLVTSHYGTLSNAVAGDPSPSVEIMHEAVKIIHKGLTKLQEEISVHGQEVEKFTPQDLTRLRRTLAVMVYLAHRALCGMEAKSVQILLGSSGKSKGKANQDDKLIGQINWRNLRSMIIEDILGILELPIERIWDDSGYGYSVPRLLIRTMCSNFNEPLLAKENLKAGNDAYKVLSIIAKRFGKPAEVFQRLFPLIKYGEDVAKLISGTIDVMTNEYDIKEATHQAFRMALELTTEIGDKNTAVMEKGISTLILDLCETTPKQVIQQCGLFLRQMLNVDCPGIRNATVQGAAHLMRWLRDHKKEAASSRNLRSLILDEILVSHCKDSNSLVRAKSLSILAKLIDEKMIDPVEVTSCFTAAVDRIVDSAVLSRKYAMSVINATLVNFPGICNQTINFREEVITARQKLLEVLARKSPRKSQYVYALVREFSEQVQIQEIPLPEAFEEAIEEGMEKLRPLISGLVRNEKYWDACLVFYHAFQRYGNEVGIVDAGKSAAKPSLYIAYFNQVTNGNGDGDESQRSLLETSLSISKSMSQEPAEDEFIENGEVTAARQILLFSQGCLKMKLQMDTLVDKLTLLLQIGNDNDRTEAIRTFGELVRCGFPVNEKVTAPIIQAIATLAKESAGALVPAFWSIFIGDREISHAQMIRNIFKILDSVDSATKELLRPIIGEMYATDAFPKPAIMVLWDAFTKRFGNAFWSEQDSQNAIFVLGALGRVDRSVMLSNFKLVVETGLSDEAVNDNLKFVKTTLEAILFSLKVTKKNESDINSTQRFKPTHEIFTRLNAILVHGVTKKGDWETHHYFPKVAELAIQIIYRLSWEQEQWTSRLLQTVPDIVFGNKNRDALPSSELKGSEEIYIRYLAIMTALLGTHINYCETVIIPEIKRRKQMQLDNPMNPNVTSAATNISRANMSRANITKSRNASALNLTTVSANNTTKSRGRGRGGSKTPRVSMASTPNSNAEMEAIIGGSGFDADLDLVKVYVEKLLNTGTFQQLRRLTLYFCQKITKIEHPKLQIAVITAMAKLMLVSAESVNKLVETFINVWNVVSDTRAKVEILKHLTHLNVRFPNQVEKCNIIIKSGLMSDNEHIKTACLDLMGFLALGDMVKIRDSIAEVALCLCSEKEVIRELARDFFDVCAEKENVISNAVPEVISQLSNRDGLSQEEFQNIMKFLLVRVKKEKQVLGLVETLVGRLKGPSDNERLWEDTAYCLSQLSHGEKSFKIIRDNIANYTDKLKNDMVFIAFTAILDALRKVITKPDLKVKLEDFEQDMADIREKCAEEERIVQAKNRQQNRKRKEKSVTSDGEKSSLMEVDQEEDDEGERSEKEGEESIEDDEGERSEKEGEESIEDDGEESNAQEDEIENDDEEQEEDSDSDEDIKPKI